MALTFDGAGIIMRLEGLREKTRNKANEDAAQPEAWPQRLKAGEKANRQRMAEVAAVDIIGDMASIRLVAQSEPSRRPRKLNKRVWASVDRDMAEVIDEGFREALRRDPNQERIWVVLVDSWPVLARFVASNTPMLSVRSQNHSAVHSSGRLLVMGYATFAQ